jgi:hypothetical protein
MPGEGMVAAAASTTLLTSLAAFIDIDIDPRRSLPRVN